MPTKRPASNSDDDCAYEGGREVKKQKITPHRGKLDAVVQEFLNLLSPTTGESLANFNASEREKERRGVPTMYMLRVETDLRALRVAKDIGSLDARLQSIDSYLNKYIDAYNRYLEEYRGVDDVDITLENVTWTIQQARDQLPRMFLTRRTIEKAKRYYP